MRATLAIAAAFALVASGGVRLERASANRQALAESWDNDSSSFSASGLTGSTLQIALSNQNEHRCEVMLTSVRDDQKINRELSDAGFRAMRCGSVTARLGQN